MIITAFSFPVQRLPAGQSDSSLARPYLFIFVVVVVSERVQWSGANPSGRGHAVGDRPVTPPPPFCTSMHKQTNTHTHARVVRPRPISEDARTWSPVGVTLMV